MVLTMFLQAMAGGPQHLQRSQTAVAVGIASAEYNNYVAPCYTAGVGVYSATGGALSVASGRLSYTFGLKGPALRFVNSLSLSVPAGWIMKSLQCAATVANLKC